MKRLATGALKLGITLTELQLEQFECYYNELITWNDRMNLTAITQYEEVQTKHFLDSLTIITALTPAERERQLSVIDIGTGGGLPGIPLKIILPHIRLVLLEATTKKCKFLHHTVNLLCLKDTEIINIRAETGAHDPCYREKFDLVLSRAVAFLMVLSELALPYCTTGGLFIAQKKGSIGHEIEQSRGVIDALGGSLKEITPISLEKLNDERYLVVIEKLRSTPPKYPRRPGIPKKRPLVN